MVWPFLSRRERLRRQASDWVARLNGPHGERDRAAFAMWYHANPEHAEAYDRIAALFQAAAGLQRPARNGGAAGATVGRSRVRTLGYAVAAAACATVLAFVLLSSHLILPGSQSGDQHATFAAAPGEARRVVLADGSEVILSSGSVVEVQIGADERRLRLVRGEGRFSVNRDARPFIVVANGAEVTAHGTQFLVRLVDGQTMVSLIEGRVDVAYPPVRGQTGQRRVTSLRPGQSLTVPSAQALPAGASAPPRRDVSSPSAMHQFDETPLAEAVARVNANGGPRIVLEDQSLAGLRISGAFRVGDSRGFADSVAAAFGLEVQQASDGSIRLRRQRARADR